MEKQLRAELCLQTIQAALECEHPVIKPACQLLIKDVNTVLEQNYRVEVYSDWAFVRSLVAIRNHILFTFNLKLCSPSSIAQYL